MAKTQYCSSCGRDTRPVIREFGREYRGNDEIVCKMCGEPYE